MTYKRKTKQNRKNYGVYFHAEKNGICTEKKTHEKVTWINRILFWI